MTASTHRDHMAMASDLTLASAAAHGDSEGFRLIMQRNNRRLFRTARSLLRDDAEAEDVVQETYVRAYAAIGQFRGESSLSTWLTRILLNEALARVRSRKRTAGFSTDGTMAEIIQFPETRAAPDPEAATAQHQIRHILERAIDALPEAFRIVFVLREVEGMSVEETAADLSIPPQTVRTRLFRARRLLRQRLSGEMEAALRGSFPFDGVRCARLTEAVLNKLGLGP